MTNEQELSDFVEEFALNWASMGSPRMEGRVIGYLLITDKPYLSSDDLAAALSASSGSISTATRRLVEVGFIKRHVVPGDRSHYFKADDDLWGYFLSRERRGLLRQRDLFNDALEGGTVVDPRARLRLTNARNYMEWLYDYNRVMLSDWQEYRDSLVQKDSGAGGKTEKGE
jgi:hypothetical protein